MRGGTLQRARNVSTISSTTAPGIGRTIMTPGSITASTGSTADASGTSTGRPKSCPAFCSTERAARVFSTQATASSSRWKGAAVGSNCPV